MSEGASTEHERAFNFTTAPPGPSLSSSPRSKAELKNLRQRRKLREKVVAGRGGDSPPPRRPVGLSARTARLSLHYSIPSGLLLLTFLLSVSLLLFPFVLPHSSSNFTKSKLYLKYTLRGFGTSDGGAVQVMGLVLLCFTVAGVLLKLLPRSVAKRLEKSFAVWGNLVAYIPFVLLAIVAACVARFSLPAYILQARSFLSPSLRFCAPSTDRISTYVAIHLSKCGYSQIDACSLADLVYLPVPWLENSHVPGSSFGGIHRGARVNQIPYGDSRIAHKSALNWHLRSAPFYATTFITEKDELEILKAENRANSSYTWIVKAGEGGAKEMSKNLVGRSVWVGENPYEGIAWLKGVGKDDEKAVRATAVITEKARVDGYDNEERREKENREAKIRQHTDLSRTELTERFLERLGRGDIEEGGGEREMKQSAESKRQELHGHHLVQRYIKKPLLSEDGYKWNLRIPVLVTAVEPVRVYAGKNAAIAEFAKEKYGEGGWYTKDGKVERYTWKRGDGKWEKVVDAIFGVVFGSVDKWKKDLEYSADLFIPAGSRPRGGGGKWGREEAKVIEERYKRELKAFREKVARDSAAEQKKRRGGDRFKDIDLEGDIHKVLFEDGGGGDLDVTSVKSEELSEVDQSSIKGGGFHVFYFDFLFDDEGGTWLLDIDSMGGEEDGMEEEEAFAATVEDAMYLAGWLDDEGGDKEEAGDYFERLLEGRNLEEAEEMQDDKSDVHICASYSKHNSAGSGILCNLRMRELRVEQKRMLEKEVIWKSVHPSMKTCESLLRGQEEMAMLDAAQCSITIADKLKMIS